MVECGKMREREREVSLRSETKCWKPEGNGMRMGEGVPWGVVIQRAKGVEEAI